MAFSTTVLPISFTDLPSFGSSSMFFTHSGVQNKTVYEAICQFTRKLDSCGE